MKLGILLPTSKLYPTLMIDFIAGVRLAISENNAGNEIELVFESLNKATDKNQILNAINKMAFQHQTDVNLVFCNFSLLEDIASSIEALQRPTIITNMGGNIPNSFESGEFIFSNSFGLWESAHLAAKWGVEKFGKKTAHGSYFYEAGYGLYSSFCQGLKEAEGEVVFNQISDLNPNPDDFQNFMQQMEVEKPNFLYVLYSERDAISFLNKLVQSEVNGKYPIVSSGVLLNNEILEKVEGSPKNIFNVSSWNVSDENDQNLKFCKSYKEQTGNDANYFALLGYESASTVCSALRQDCWSKQGKDQAQAIRKSNFMGPRGLLNYDNEINSTEFENHIYGLDKNGNKIKIESIGVLESRSNLIDKSKNNKNLTGWFQPYLCQ